MEVGKPSILNGFINQPNAQYVIPIYQRNYVWKKENIDQLMSDLEKMIQASGDPKRYHFFGTVVFIETLSNGFFHEYTIIDGQQRLTTIFLILQAIKQTYPNSGEIIDENYLFNKSNSINGQDQQQRYRLKPLVSDDNMYLRISNNDLNNLTKDEEDSNIYKRFIQIKRTIESWKNKYDFGIILTAIDKLKIVWIKLDTDEEPQQVFESINSTGVNLTAADLIRNFVLMNKNDEVQTFIYKNFWEKIEFHHVLTKNLKEFFRFYVSIKKESTIPEREVYELFKEEYGILLQDYTETEIMEDVLKYAEMYGYITRDSSPLNSQKIEKELEDYRNAKTNMPTMVLMETLKLYSEDKINEDDVAKTIKLLTNYVVRRNICGEESRFISYIFGRLIRKIKRYFSQTGNYYESVVRAVVSDNISLGQYMPDDKVVREQFQKGNLYSRDETSFVLKRIENNSDRIPYSSLNIEHIMPQTKSKAWENKINSGSVYEDVVNRIGNLTLVDNKDNSTMGNKDFESKKEVLSKSRHIKMNEDVLNKEDWNEEEIIKRADILADKFIEIFPYPELPVDLPLVVNLNEDDEDVFRQAKICHPVELDIGNDISFAVSSWDEVYKKIMEYYYKVDHKRFLDSFDKRKETSKGLRASFELGNNVYVEANMDTISRLKLLQSILKKMNIEDHIRIIYSRENEGDNDLEGTLFDIDDITE